jgi:hypothetical protein
MRYLKLRLLRHSTGKAGARRQKKPLLTQYPY